MSPIYLTPEQAAEKIQMCVESIRRMLRDGRLKGIRVSRKCWRISEVELDAFMRRRQNA